MIAGIVLVMAANGSQEELLAFSYSLKAVA